MELNGLSIPPRIVSPRVLQLEADRAWLTGYIISLVRKHQNLIFEKDPINRLRSLIVELDNQMQEQRIYKITLDAERYRTSDEIYHKEHRNANEALDILGDGQWIMQKALRKQKEEEGLVPKLGPDTKGLFVPTLLALYKDPPVSRKRFSLQVQRQMKKSAIAAYEARKGAPIKGTLWCCITQDYHDQSQVRAVHIVPHALGSELVDYMFGTGSGLRLDRVDNCLLVHEYVGEAFRKGHIVLLPVDASESPILRWKIQLTNSGATYKLISGETLSGLDGKEVLFKNDNRPAARFLYYHFAVTLLRNKRNRQPGWEKYCVDLTRGRPFAAMGPFMRESMLLALVRTGDLYAAAEKETWRLGCGGETFMEGPNLSGLEEGEVARRVWLAHEVGDDEDGDEEDDDDEEEDDEDDEDEGDEESSSEDDY